MATKKPAKKTTVKKSAPKKPAPKKPTAYTSPAAARTAKKTPTTTKATTTSAAKKTTSRLVYQSELGAKTIAAQQRLSNQMGVATFSHTKNNYGKISTVPTARSGGFSDIYVGLGSYANFDDFANAAIQTAVSNEKQARQEGRGVTVTNEGAFVPSFNETDPIIVSDPYSPTRYVDLAASMEANKPILTNEPPTSAGGAGGSLEKFGDMLVDNAPKIGIGIALLVLVLALVKKKW